MAINVSPATDTGTSSTGPAADVSSFFTSHLSSSLTRLFSAARKESGSFIHVYAGLVEGL